MTDRDVETVRGGHLGSCAVWEVSIECDCPHDEALDRILARTQGDWYESQAALVRELQAELETAASRVYELTDRIAELEAEKETGYWDAKNLRARIAELEEGQDEKARQLNDWMLQDMKHQRRIRELERGIVQHRDAARAWQRTTQQLQARIADLLAALEAHLNAPSRVGHAELRAVLAAADQGEEGTP